ncbi:helix-turn-helix domain-containing protein [Pseudaminobacter sp. 19-2017]|uniref:Helix-turn-helix domain-containing protein n=1 Tax=Pseudaminobacter soli (ex Zhang et al. 2022) TaxID=2831468 RepID=A0A942DVY1_9HYPH|nr:helix-turn-helix domain-containing protein [Pseudaminobacter soli]MBS3647863.1 helix-turn-helix domain-containing protein [Pseudaminobacter soli]
MIENGQNRQHKLEEVRKLDDETVVANALTDPDALPLSKEFLATARRSPRVKIIRRVLHLTQEEFASRYMIPLGTLRDWEQGRTEPDQAAQAYLHVIAQEPETVARALGTRSAA